MASEGKKGGRKKSKKVLNLEVSERGFSTIRKLTEVFGEKSPEKGIQKGIAMASAIVSEMQGGGELCILRGEELARLNFEGLNLGPN